MIENVSCDPDHAHLRGGLSSEASHIDLDLGHFVPQLSYERTHSDTQTPSDRLQNLDHEMVRKNVSSGLFSERQSVRRLC